LGLVFATETLEPLLATGPRNRVEKFILISSPLPDRFEYSAAATKLVKRKARGRIGAAMQAFIVNRVRRADDVLK